MSLFRIKRPPHLVSKCGGLFFDSRKPQQVEGGLPLPNGLEIAYDNLTETGQGLLLLPSRIDPTLAC